ncbi:formate/nitrite transporter family protein [Microbulbifer celer]|uniref:Formate/nitrite transporter family protein n=1 Tax=Microbulbifer celer TaxID=435905 RepID=A0ABW3UBL8_9GAMM|nr:formate/nitrite transporter family protein [Microbulbifer celer]UFN57021.1 formate/nitrite transporter family protein [Microbulbifer celer]
MSQSDENDRPKSDSEILQEQMQDSLHEYRRNNRSLFLSSLAAGLEIGFSLFLMAAFYSHFHNGNSELVALMIALSYPIGFILVIIGRTDLFTEHTTLAILPVLSGRQNVLGLMRVWGVIYAGNILGAILFSFLFVQFVGMTERLDGGIFTYYGEKLLGDNGAGQFVGAIFAGWLMGLLGWMVASSAETISRMAVVALITFVIGLGGLAHCVAGAVGIFCALFSPDAAVTFADALKFLAIATLGNTIGGSIFVGLLKYSYVVNDES